MYWCINALKIINIINNSIRNTHEKIWSNIIDIMMVYQPIELIKSNLFFYFSLNFLPLSFCWMNVINIINDDEFTIQFILNNFSVAPPVLNWSYQLRNLCRLICNNDTKDHNIIKCIVCDSIRYIQTNIHSFFLVFTSYWRCHVHFCWTPYFCPKYLYSNKSYL